MPAIGSVLKRLISSVRLLCSPGLFLALFLAITGCAELKGPSADHGLFAAKLQYCKPGYIPPCDTFGPGEIPAIVFGFQNGRTVTVRITEINNGNIAWNNTAYVPRDNTTNWWSLKSLPSGAYKAELLEGNTLLQSCNFNVTKTSAGKR